MLKEIDLNTDFGEGYSVFAFPMQVWRSSFERGGDLRPSELEPFNPAYVMERVTSINLACGFHGGDPLIIKRYAELAKKYECNVGAHPSFPDLQGFGNRYMELTNAEIKAMLQYQIGALEGILRTVHMNVHHVKCHGALYNRSMVDESLAESIVEGIAEYDDSMKLIVPPYSAIQQIAHKKGVPCLLEAFADRMYEPNGELVDRKKEHAMVTNPDEIANRVLKMVKDGIVIANDGTNLKIEMDTICFHTDTPNANSSLEKSVQLLIEHNIKLNRNN